MTLEENFSQEFDDSKMCDATKRPYVAPELVLLGILSDITLGAGGNKDDGVGQS